MLHFSFSDHAPPSINPKWVNDFYSTINNPDIGFFHLPKENLQNKTLSQLESIFEQFSDRHHFVHIGIGGSALGPEMLISSLGKTQTQFHFLNNIDPDYLHEQLEKIDLKNALIHVVSKSGATAETLATLAIITQKLKSMGLNEEQLKNSMVFTTDPDQGQLLELAQAHEITTLPVPRNIGGRFSVLTPVGLLPARFAGLSLESLLEGADEMSQRILQESAENPLHHMCSLLMSYYQRDNRSQTVLMPYSSKLRDFSFWFTQLWAESLGKKHDKNGAQVHTGLSPIPAYGATDQHSQMQLFMHGKNDKYLIFIEVEQFTHDFSLSCSLESPGLNELKPYTLGQLFRAELLGTLQALQKEKRPFAHIKIPQLNEKYLGQLILYFEALTALMGEALEINTFDQPGVEDGKRFAYQWLKKL